MNLINRIEDENRIAESVTLKELLANVNKCSICQNMDKSRVQQPCLSCSYNEKYSSHYKPHVAIENLIKTAASK